MFGAISLEAQAMDILSGKPLPMLPGAELLRSFTQQPSAVVAQQKAAIASQQVVQLKAIIEKSWSELVKSTVTT